MALPLPPPAPHIIWLSSRCCVQDEGEWRVVVVGGAPLLRFAVGDQVEARLAAALIVEARAARVQIVLDTFGLDDAMLWRDRQRLREGGVAALVPSPRGPKGPSKVLPAVVKRMVALRKTGLTLARIAQRLGLSETSVRTALKRAGVGLPVAPRDTAPLFVPAAPGASLSVATDDDDDASTAPTVTPAASTREGVADPLTTPVPATAPPLAPPAVAAAAAPAAPVGITMSRAATPTQAVVFALLGLSPDAEAEVVFQPRQGVPGLGVLLAVPALTATGLFDAARTVYGRLRRGIYGLRATFLVLAALALLRRPRPEHLKTVAPDGLGDVLGLLRAPEVKTVRRKLAELARVGRAHELLRTLGTRWLRECDDVLGVLYVDGHVRVYHGQEKLPKTHVTQRSLCMPATTDYWVNDASGDPVFMLTAAANAAMTKVLPALLAELAVLGGGRKGTVVFDRGGWSPKLFKQLIDAGWHILTYRKGRKCPHPPTGFTAQTMTIDGRQVSYTLSERSVQLRNGLSLREIAELRDDGGQTVLLTDHTVHPAVLLAHRMFARWRQENYFRYMKQNFLLDALVDYDTEPDDLTRAVPNPARKALDVQLREARTHLAELERTYGAAAVDNPEVQRPTMRGFKIAHGATGKQLRAARAQVTQLTTQRRALPTHVPVGTVLEAAKVVRLSRERKLLTDTIKAAVYRAESALLRLVRPHLSRADAEGRAFLRTAVAQPGDILVQGDDLVVRLAPMSAPRYTAALRALCNELNALQPRFPETTYRMRYEVAEPAEAL
jgi:hypothetical protein